MSFPPLYDIKPAEGKEVSDPHGITQQTVHNSTTRTNEKATMRENILPTSVMRAFQALRYIPLRYFALVTKINKKGKAQERVIVLTELHLYSCTKEDGSIKRCLSLSDIVRVITCRNRSEVALVVMEGGAEYDLLFQAHSPAAMDEFLKHIPKDVEVKDMAMSLLGNHNGSDGALHLEKPKGYSRDVADAVKYKVSSYSTLEKGSRSSAAAAARNTAGVPPSSILAVNPSSPTSLPQPQQQLVTSGDTSQSATPAASPSTNNLVLEDSERMSVRTTTSTAVGKQVPTSASGIAGRLTSMISFDDDEDDDFEDSQPRSRRHTSGDEVVNRKNGVNADGEEVMSSSSRMSPPGSPIGHLMSTDMAHLHDDAMNYSINDGSDDGVEDTPFVRKGTHFGDDDDEFDDDDEGGSELDIAFDRVHPTISSSQPRVVSPASPGSARRSSKPSLLEAVAASNTASHRQSSPNSASLPPPDRRRGSAPVPIPELPIHVPASNSLVSSSLVRDSDSSFLWGGSQDHTNELMSLLHEERTKFASQILLTSELLSMERENGTLLRRIIDDLRLEVEQLTFENMMLKRSSSEL
ncbi:Hypothetical protein, putative [Bodo saltans]|uniref:Uncharacterized protein n=1 Tax=Bodo saltans TaxID=75058 RepID=A0A0S4IZJ0_BODSA|nr:Hypothetical protein, putative [Bodo saltans]|eukprot:CUG23429.1 Hypothetical protein, putative [Bodo saltans]